MLRFCVHTGDRECGRRECYNVHPCVGRHTDVSEDTACAAIRCTTSQLQVMASSAGFLAKMGEGTRLMEVRRQIENDMKD